MDIKWGMIGAGDVTEIKSGPAFSKIEGSELIAVMRRNEAKVIDYAKRHGINRWYTDAASIFHDREINAVYIATPPNMHLTYAQRALESGKMVYVEKPMVLHLEEAKQLEQWVNKYQGKLVVAHYRRAMPYFEQVAHLIKTGAIGQPRMASLATAKRHVAQTEVKGEQYNWRLDPTVSGGGLFHDLAPHQIDFMIQLFGVPIAYKGLSDNNIPAQKVAGQILFEQNLLFNGTWCFDAETEQDSCVVYGTEGNISFSFFDNSPIKLYNSKDEKNFDFPLLPHVQQPMIEKVIRYFRGEGENPCSVQDGIINIKILDTFTSAIGE